MTQINVRSVNSKLITKSWNKTLENIIQDFKNDIYDDVSVGPRLDCVFMYITEIMTKADDPSHPASYWTDEECMLFMDVLTTHFVNELYGQK